MPTYQYACMNADCGNQFDLVQSFTDPAASECPVCAGPVRKVYSAVGVVFKGSGFYRTDSRAADGKANGAGSERKQASKSEGKSESKSEGTSASKTESKSESSSSAASSAASSSSAPAKAAASA